MTVVRENPVIERLVDSFVIDQISISPSGRKIIYTIRSFGHRERYKVSSLWFADVGVPGSCRQLTLDQHYDFSPQWSPDGRSVAFLSNRDVSEGYYIYLLDDKDLSDTEAPNFRCLSVVHNITKFYWSPDSKSIAFLSPDQKYKREGCTETPGDDVEVFGEWKYTRPYLLDLKTGEVMRLYDKDAQVKTLSWSPDASQILLAIYRSPELDSPYRFGTQFEVLSIGGHSTVASQFLSTFPGPVLSDNLVWENDKIFFVSGVSPNSVNSSQAIYCLHQQGGVWRWHKHSHGDIDCVTDLRSDRGLAFGNVQSGLADEIHVLGIHDQAEFVIYSANEQIDAWDARATNEGEFVLALAKGNTLRPPELYTVKAEHHFDNVNHQISHHNQNLSDSLDLQIYSEVIKCKSQDGTTDLDALFIAPSLTPFRKLPTCVFIHGGPYERATFSFNSSAAYLLWEALILSLSLQKAENSAHDPHHFAILEPNYRGGSSRGEKFAAYARGRVGTVDYDDVISLVDAGIAQGLVDPEKIIVGGWSQGGILSYLLATRRNLEVKVGDWMIRGAICGAGGTDLDMLSLTSDHPYFEAELVGGAPWDPKRDNSIAENASAIRRLRAHRSSETVPPILILHGQEDKRIPVGQAVSFHRACRAYGISCEMATYPREPHLIGETAHLIDLLRRVSRFCITHLSP
ncbi:Alpha/Beta hydrolase protein [Xylogone sp. PMI_703]|nr:Alpha/Beta hydrolase protein [Xylogone sp. PMI_703]